MFLHTAIAGDLCVHTFATHTLLVNNKRSQYCHYIVFVRPRYLNDSLKLCKTSPATEIEFMMLSRSLRMISYLPASHLAA